MASEDIFLRLQRVLLRPSHVLPRPSIVPRETLYKFLKCILCLIEDLSCILYKTSDVNANASHLTRGRAGLVRILLQEPPKYTKKKSKKSYKSLHKCH